MISISSFSRAFHEQSLIFYEGKQDPVVTEVERAVRDGEKRERYKKPDETLNL